jgi:hypothetical protein
MNCLRWRHCFVFAVLTMASVGTANASKAHHSIQSASPAVKAEGKILDECDAVDRSDECYVLVDASSKEAKAVLVHNLAHVKIVVQGEPFATCSISGENRAAEKQETPFASVITSVGGLGLTFPFAVMNAPLSGAASANLKAEIHIRGLKESPTLAVAAPDDERNGISSALDRAVAIEERINSALKQIQKKYEETSKAANDELAVTFKTDDELKIHVKNAASLLSGELDSADSIVSLYQLLEQLRALNRRVRVYEDTHPNANQDWLAQVEMRMDQLNSAKERLQETEKLLSSARDGLRGLRDYLAPNKFSLQQEIALVPDQNSSTTGNLTCVDDQSKASWGQDVPLSITYDELPRWSFSAGVLFSSLGRLQYGIRPQATTPPVSPQTATNVINKTDRSSFQIIPFSFMNYRLKDWVWKEHQFTFGVAGGLGVNPNNGDNQAEFFEGGSLSIGSVSFYLGCHNGRRQRLGNGFTLNETVDPAVTNLPINHIWWNQPAIGVSYRIPLGG